ncbi:hypothetical protein JB92DRAFT_803261 [Gautieria morchelliformis]|nr:hypothetical protein JB92DRAFT_803261 [Gautieria morchelliformis]
MLLSTCLSLFWRTCLYSKMTYCLALRQCAIFECELQLESQLLTRTTLTEGDSTLNTHSHAKGLGTSMRVLKRVFLLRIAGSVKAIRMGMRRKKDVAYWNRLYGVQSLKRWCIERHFDGLSARR